MNTVLGGFALMASSSIKLIIKISKAEDTKEKRTTN